MEYIFGTIRKRGKDVDNLKTVGTEHTNLTGKHTLERRYPDCTITDTFFIDEKYLSKEDSEGNCYDWYAISNHSRYIDYFSPQKEDLVNGIDDAQNATCELSEEVDARITDIELALCELTEEE